MSTIVSVPHQGFINGMPIASCDISMSRGYDIDKFLNKVFLSPTQIDVAITIIISSNWQVESLTDLCLGAKSIVSLGNGRVCPYCGDYNPAGLAKCWRCGGQTEIEQFAKIDDFPFILTSYQLPSLPESLGVLNMDFVSTGTVSISHLPFFNLSLSIEGLPYTYIPNTGYYLCRHCGSIVDNGKICPNCGGVRIPWSEVVKMDRNCLYCGKKVVGGVVCSNCGGRIAAESYRMYKEA